MASLSMGFSRQENWSGLPFPSPRDLPDPGMKLGLLHWQADSLTAEPPGKPTYTLYMHTYLYLKIHTHTHTHTSIYTSNTHSYIFRCIYISYITYIWYIIYIYIITYTCIRNHESTQLSFQCTGFFLIFLNPYLYVPSLQWEPGFLRPSTYLLNSIIHLKVSELLVPHYHNKPTY